MANSDRETLVPLITVPFEVAPIRLPPDIRRFLRAGTRRIERFNDRFRIPAFVTSDFDLAYAALYQLEESGLASGDQFVEWGSGIGIVSCLAALVGYVANGIEVESRLIDAARRLAADFDVPVEFTRGSFIPSGAKPELLPLREFSWLSTGGRCGHEKLGIGIEEFDVIYAYPWPDEECLVSQLFERKAKVGALLMTYHGEIGFQLRRKTVRIG